MKYLQHHITSIKENSKMLSEGLCTVSVAMAVYNGESYIHAQIDSILKQLCFDGELIISYNESNDSTWGIINDYRKKDSRIKVYVCEEKGIQANFENAIIHSSGKYIFLSDQDDVWEDNKICRVLDVFRKTDADVVQHECFFTDAGMNILFQDNIDRKYMQSFVRNMWINHFSGGCMAFSTRIKPYILPIPRNVQYHDIWIGLLAVLFGKVETIHEPLSYHRLHSSNCSVSKRRKLSQLVKTRLVNLFEVLRRTYEILKIKKNFDS